MENVETKKAKTHKGRLYLKKFEPKLIENPKECLFINTENSSEIMRMVLSDLVYKNLIIVCNEKRILKETRQEK